jgi:D-alanyl-D-alanine carboxypeptidase-like protein
MPTFSSLSKQDWPREWISGELDSFYGNPRGSAGRADQAWVQQNLTRIVPPWSMRSDGSAVSQITIHRKCKDSLTRILNAIWESTGRDQAKIKAAHLDEFDGSYNFRVNVNSPSRLSLHAYGAAIDIAAAENPNGASWRDNGRMLPRWAIDAFLAEGWSWGGDFSGTPDAMHFQATFNRHADAPQGQQQPASISNASEPLTANTKFTVTGTVFGGPRDDQAVAYADVGPDWANHPGVALPFRFRGPRPKVTVSANGKSVVCPIVDVGPWNTNDPYWMTAARPQAESGTDMSGRRTNGAGIDLTPATAAAIGLDGKGQVVWFFDSTGVGPMSDVITTHIPQLNLLNLPQLQAIKDQIDGLIKKNAAGQQIDNLIKQGGVVGPLTLPKNVDLSQLSDINKQLEVFVQLATNILPIISTFVPQLKVLIPILPVLTGLLKMGDDIAQAGSDPTKIADALTAHLKDVAQQVQASKVPGLN